ncbi:MAG: Glu/Leu/Phe/Val dehydrogenase [Gammaproteobacteria bacterium AqS3]|nr:Glu/Leu/Phe/Val dehydrogenase [Gammaproteobacteria bacterium AqS3]
MEIESLPVPEGYEEVKLGRDTASGMTAIVAIHNTNIGPALGGTRFLNYPSQADALEDVLRLAHGMTYKSAIAGLNYGGGKCVLLGDPSKPKTEEQMLALGRFVNSFEGRYITTEDMNMAIEDLEIVRRESRHVCGLLSSPHSSGHPGLYTAHGVFHGLLAAVRHQLGRSDDLTGLRICVQGLGSVGGALVEKLHAAGAELLLADINTRRAEELAERFGCETFDTHRAHAADVDVFSPCARGAGLNSKTIGEISARVIAGCANNQLDTPGDDDLLWRAGILYAPDYVINCGGVVAVSFEIEESTMTREERMASVERTDPILTQIFERARSENIATGRISNAIAEERFLASAA